ncbi:MAG: glycosyltransferase family 2 protein [Acidobacteriota bacterium]|jgi:hypothetical protein|nr:glycosyltransferase family 2 protein [Acidobacteriota bacterium]
MFLFTSMKKAAKRTVRIVRKMRTGLRKLDNLEDIVSMAVREEAVLQSLLQNRPMVVPSGEADLVVSLTTYGKRSYAVHLTIETLLNQTMRPKRVILWLDGSEFSDSSLPVPLRLQRERGLEIAYCHDVKSYKKLVPALAKHPDETIVTIDDDILYPFDLIESLYREHAKSPKQVLCTRCHRMIFDAGGKLKPYNEWRQESTDTEASPLLFPTGVGGVLYPPHCLHEDVSREDLFMSLAPTADDVWFKAMSLLRGTSCRRVKTCALLYSVRNQDIALQQENVRRCGNDRQIKKVFDYYNLWGKLKGS